MPSLTEAQAALASAQATAEKARLTAERAASTSANLRAEVLAGNPNGVSPDTLAKAAQEADHADLLALGAQRAIPTLSEAVQLARADETCDGIVSTLPVLGSRVLDALDRLVDDVGPLAAAVRAYDDFTDQAKRNIDSTARNSPRVEMNSRTGFKVDRLPIRDSAGWRQLASVIVPAMQSLGAPTHVVDGLKEIARTRPSIPS